MAKKTRSKKILWVGVILAIFGLGALLFLFSQKPEETKASESTWLQEKWSGGAGEQFFTKGDNKYWTKTNTIDDQDGITLKKISSKEPTGSGKGTDNSTGDGKQTSGTEKQIKGSLISSVLDTKDSVLITSGKLEVNLPENTTANLYFQTGTLKEKIAEGEKVDIKTGIKWSDWVNFKQTTVKGSSAGNFLRYRVDLVMPETSEISPHVLRVSVNYKPFSQSELDLEKSQVIAESPVKTGNASTIYIQLKDTKGKVITLPESWITLEASGLSGLRVTQPVLDKTSNFAGDNFEKKQTIYTASVFSKNAGTAQVEVTVNTSGGSASGVEGEGSEVAGKKSNLILNDHPEIKFVEKETAKYFSKGHLDSLVFDAGSEVKWNKLHYETDLYQGTSIQVGVRVANSTIALGDYQVFSSESDLNLKGRYFQYRVSLATENSLATPIFKKLTASYSPVTKKDKETPAAQVAQFNNVDANKSNATATTPHRAGIDRSRVAVTLKDQNNNPIKDFPSERIGLSTEPKFGTIIYDQAKQTDSEGRIIYQCASTTVARKTLTVTIKDETGKDSLILNDHPVIDFVDANDKNVYLKSGELNSLIFDAGQVSGWNKITWDAVVPKGTTMRVMIIMGNDLELLKKNIWDVSKWKEVKNGQNLRIKARYFKYKILFNNSNPHLTPILKSIKVDYQGLEG